MSPGRARRPIRLPTRWASAAALAALLAAAACGGAAAPPNLVWIVVDTVRADHLPFYGYARDTAPELGALVARRGTLAEHAYAQAPWTLPSAASYLTGLDPARLARGDGEVAGIPRGVPTLAERLRARGYATAAFTANFLLARHNGFARGFDHFWTAQGVASLRAHADSMQGPLLEWLRGRRDERPLFLYVHYLDPHDPYDNPDMPGGVSGFDPHYRGPVGGGDAHRLYAGGPEPGDLAAAVERLTALYDGEIRYADRFAGELVAEARRRLGRDTLFVVSSDHGEELHDHGGWKHGQTLYEEQLRVPLLFRWDGRIVAGRRLGGPEGGETRLLDVAPTLLAAAGAPSDPALDGVDLLPALLDRGRQPPRRPAFASHWNFGRRRSAVIAERRKTILYSHREPFVAEQPLRARLEALDLARLAPVERYDLDADPRERQSFGARAPAEPELLDALLRGLDPSLRGTRVVARGLPDGARVRAELRLERAPERVRPLFLADGDRLEVDGATIRFELVGDGIPKGFELVGGGAILAIEREGAYDDVTLRLGAGEPYAGGPVPADRLALARPLPPATGAELRLWTLPAAAPAADPEADAETERRLRALGYLN